MQRQDSLRTVTTDRSISLNLHHYRLACHFKLARLVVSLLETIHWHLVDHDFLMTCYLLRSWRDTYFGWEYFLRASLQEQVNFHSRKVGCGKCVVLVSRYLNVATRWDCNRRSCSLESSIYEQKLSYGIILYMIDQEYVTRHKRRTLSAYKEASTAFLSQQ